MEVQAQKVKNAKKKPVIRLWMLITAAVLLILLVGIIIMACIPLKALSDDAFSNYLYVNVYDRNGGTTPMLSVKNDRKLPQGAPEHEKTYARLLREGLNGTEHSVLRSAAEFVFVGGLRFITQEVDRSHLVYDENGFKTYDEEGLEVSKAFKTVDRVEREVRSEAHLREIMQSPGPGRYVLEFVFCDQTQYTAIHEQIEKEIREKKLNEKDRDAEFIQRKKQIQPSVVVRDDSTDAKYFKQQDVTVHFDRVRIVINDSQNVIQDYAMYLYDSEELETGEAVLSPVWISMNTTALYGKLCELRKIARDSDDNGEYLAPENGGQEF